ncbi:heme-binding protein [Bradyrhizobium sp. LTSP857]|uniref:GlcG/HbpS family heme-binding protein n=1 Tax=Bradyrhizobium sp. LTSP857 TaxID=1619231 RepID=UPI000678F29F|nr:heme-binding protein [Bradyrhizobium sp. LTSP857]
MYSLLADGAPAEELLTERQLPLSLALDGARAALDGCLSQNYKIAVTVVDRSGQVRATLRADGANPHLLEGALRKAYTASMLRISTVQMGTFVERSPGANGLMVFEHMTALGGGLPIRIGDDVVGGIGVAGVAGVPVGGAGGAGDEGCARIGLDRIVSRLIP